MKKPSIAVSKDPFHLADYLLETWPHFKARFERMTGNKLMLTCTYRSIEEQQRLYKQGRTTPGKIVTWVDGVKKQSNHNKFPARAFDVAVVKDGKITWDEKSYLPLGECANYYSLVWGGTWKVKDLPHVELPKDL